MKYDELGRNYEDGEVVYREGDSGDCMFVIQSGKIRLSKSTPDGEIFISTLQVGEIFGATVLFDDLPRDVTATCYGPTRLLTVDRKKYFRGITRDPTLAFKILEVMSGRIRRLNNDNVRLQREKLGILRAALNVKEICDIILRWVSDVVEADSGSIMLLDEDGETLSIVTAFGKEQPKKTSLKLGEGIAGQVLETCQAQMVNDVSSNPFFKPGGAAIHSIVCIPLVSNERKMGVLNLTRTSRKPFHVQDLRFVQFLAAYSTLAIENSIRFNELKEKIRSLTGAEIKADD